MLDTCCPEKYAWTVLFIQAEMPVKETIRILFFLNTFLCVRQVCSTVQIHLFKHLISASDTKKEHLNDRVENSVRWTVMNVKKGFSAENPPC